MLKISHKPVPFPSGWLLTFNVDQDNTNVQNMQKMHRLDHDWEAKLSSLQYNSKGMYTKERKNMVSLHQKKTIEYVSHTLPATLYV